MVYYFGENKVRFFNLLDVRLIKYLRVEEEFIKVVELNIGKYLNNFRSIKYVF